MEIRIDDLEVDDGNIAEMAAHRVSVREVFEVFWNNEWSLLPNKKPHASEQPYVMIGQTDGGRWLFIPMKPLANNVWRPATAYDCPKQLQRKGHGNGGTQLR